MKTEITKLDITPDFIESAYSKYLESNYENDEIDIILKEVYRLRRKIAKSNDNVELISELLMEIDKFLYEFMLKNELYKNFDFKCGLYRYTTNKFSFCKICKKKMKSTSRKSHLHSLNHVAKTVDYTVDFYSKVFD
jgi:hypothetical protein